MARDVVRHLTEWFPAFLSNTAGIALPAGPSIDDDPVAAWAWQRDAVTSLLDDASISRHTFDFGPIGLLPLDEAVDRVYTTDVFLHRWDLGTATGQDVRLDPDECTRLLIGMLPMDDALRRSGHYGPRIHVSADADPQTLLLAFIGRA